MRAHTLRKRAQRRHNAGKAKRKAVRKLHQWEMGATDQRVVGKWANTACPCSCETCGNPRRHFKELTIQERRHNQQTEEV